MVNSDDFLHRISLKVGEAIASISANSCQEGRSAALSYRGDSDRSRMSVDVA